VTPSTRHAALRTGRRLGKRGIAIQEFSDNNAVRANDAEHNPFGISVADENTGNLIQANQALHNTRVDVSDGNADCDSNVWKSNQFRTANQTCIQ
jgi:parallel beta-helix repeat protein